MLDISADQIWSLREAMHSDDRLCALCDVALGLLGWYRDRDGRLWHRLAARIECARVFHLWSLGK